MNRIKWTGRVARVSVFGLVIFALALFPGCGSDSPTDPGTSGASGTLVSHGECKDMGTSNTMDGTPPNLDCIFFDYDGSGRLNLVHVNTAFNCCPVGIGATVDINGYQIIITETESSGECTCMCLYDLEYVIDGLPPGVYELTVIGHWIPQGEEPLVCQLDLGSMAAGECCIERHGYPWG